MSGMAYTGSRAKALENEIFCYILFQIVTSNDHSVVDGIQFLQHLQENPQKRSKRCPLQWSHDVPVVERAREEPAKQATYLLQWSHDVPVVESLNGPQ